MTEHTEPEREHDPSTDQARIRALISEQLATCVFQPIVHVNQGEIIGYEALLRPSPESGYANPHELFSAASRCGMTDELEQCSREIILQSATDWPVGTMLFMNCEPRTAAKRGFASSLIQQIDRIGTVPHENIVLEITERAETDDLNTLLEQLRTIRAAGVHVAIDDLGAGTSGLQRIMQLRPQWLKIDRDLIIGIAGDDYRRNLVDVLVRFTRVSGVRLVAEGIESHEDLGVIMDMGVQHVQGYLLARPSDSLLGLESEIRAWMLGHHVHMQKKRLGPNPAMLSGIMREPFMASEHMTISEVRERYWAANGPSGVVLLDEDSKAVGWVTSERLMSVQFDNEPDLRVSDLIEPLPETIVPSILISEALHLLSSRRGHKMSEPFLIGHEGKVLGEISVPEVLQEAARLTGDIDGYYTQLSGLPGRVQCERQLDSLLRQDHHVSAIFVDIVGFHTYNEQFGYEVGDLILRILAGTMTNYVEDQERGEFTGHLGDDRFLLVTFSEHPDEVSRAIIEEFEQATDRFVLCGILPERPDTVSQQPGQVSLRTICVRDAGAQGASTRMLCKIARTLIEQGPVQSIGHSQFIDTGDHPSVGHLRLSA